MAHYRTAWLPEYRILLDVSFWANANGNCMDRCVLEWWKLFADSKDKHFWRNVVSNPEVFRNSLLDHLSVTVSEFEQKIRKMRSYRDKFLAHLDSERIMNIPELDIAYKSLAFYHNQVISEAKRDDLQELQLNFERGYQGEVAEASRVYKSAVESSRS